MLSLTPYTLNPLFLTLTLRKPFKPFTPRYQKNALLDISTRLFLVWIEQYSQML